jgi:hypothetical protein
MMNIAFQQGLAVDKFMIRFPIPADLSDSQALTISSARVNANDLNTTSPKPSTSE